MPKAVASYAPILASLPTRPRGMGGAGPPLTEEVTFFLTIGARFLHRLSLFQPVMETAGKA
jgi:hypothetical protein